MRKVTGCLTLLALLAILCSLPLTALAGGGPQDAVDAFFGYLKKGDMAGAKTVFSGPALEKPPAKGTKKYQMMQLWGEAYQGVETMKVTGDKAAGMVKMDGKKIADAMMAARLAMLDKIKDPAEKATETERYKKALASFAAKLSKLPISLIKKDGAWLVKEIK